MTTFSQLVDELAAEVVRPDLRTTICSYVNQTIRELHSRRDSGLPVQFASNRVETEVTAAELPFVWSIPNVARFQSIESIFDPATGQYLRQKTPGDIYRDTNHPFPALYYYRSGPTVVLNGIAVGASVKMSYFEYPRLLTYYASDERPAVWDSITEVFTYLAAYESTSELQETAESLTTNWLLLRWGELVIKEGVRAKVWKRLAELDRARLAYSAYSSLRDQLVATEEWYGDQRG